jgi:hypothetical protein
MSNDQLEGAVAPTSVAQVIEVVREVTRQLAPDELLDFDAVADAWSSGQVRPRRVRGTSVGLGIEVIVLSELVFPIITGAIGQVLGTVAMEQIQPRHRSRHSARARRRHPAQVGAGTAGRGGSRGEPLTREQAQDLRDTCRELACADLPPAEAARLADVILDTLRCELWRSGQ